MTEATLRDMLLLLWEEAQVWEEQPDVDISSGGHMRDLTTHHIVISNMLLKDLMMMAGIKKHPMQSDLEALASASALDLAS